MTNLIKKCINGLKNPKKRIIFLAQHGFFRNMTDEDFLKMQFKNVFGYPLDLEHPKTFNEKLQWLKLYDRKPEYTMMVDKYEVKHYVASLIGAEYIIKTLGVWDSFDKIDFAKLPNKFVLKCTHDSGGLIICTDKSKLNLTYAKKKIEKSLSNNYYMQNREWPYKDVKRRILAEEYIENDTNSDLVDYKLMCFNGKVKATFTCTSRHSQDGLKVTFYDSDWNMMPFERYYPKEKIPLPKPSSYSEMVRLAEILSKNIPFMRVDFYEIKGKPYFGELTFYPGSGMEPFTPSEWDEKFGEWISLPDKREDRKCKCL